MTIVRGDDVPEELIRKLFSQVVRETAAVNPAFMSWPEDSIIQAIVQYQFRVLMTDQGQPAAFICLLEAQDWLEILALGTLAEFQRRGYLQKLLASVVSECAAASKKLVLEVHSQNKSAIALYQKCGFQTVRVRKKYYSDLADAFVMDLTPELP